jgi:hypothetical protein
LAKGIVATKFFSSFQPHTEAIRNDQACESNEFGLPVKDQEAENQPVAAQTKTRVLQSGKNSPVRVADARRI